ncbi:FAD binding domain-containing protein [Aspergillus coremiiformis]|uniref:FAD binding domain-containing protein n=1 Tax=Aspergillus coremiiformis TaxID=138285 RepID=A0A5N6Z234_9EURO|nr:FAD binding domain-containing protein [Aspergillus coremiiformis]
MSFNNPPQPSGAFQTRCTDVLIVGAGPAGCMAAATLLRYNIDFCLIDKRPTRTQTGHASAFQPRTQEILQTMDLLHTLDGKGHRLTETSFWNRDNQGNLVRSFVGAEVVHPTPYQYLFNTDQGLTEDTYETYLASKGQKVHRFMEFIEYKYNNNDHQWPLTAYIKNNATGSIEAWLTKYILGTDGARSATRKATGIQSSSQGSEDVWAVADVYLDTNFPDYRRRCVLRTPQGGCMLIPRKDEGLRMFLQLDERSQSLISGAKRPQSQSSLHMDSAYRLTQIVQSHISNVIHPYQANITSIVWISRYHVTQRVVHHFHDEQKRVFLLGDACHTHSPKAGQGMNVSICDAYNLTWKLAFVLKGIASPSLLLTYELERLHIAQQLIEFDARFAHQFGQKENLDSQNLRDTWEKSHGFTSGCGYKYPPSIIVDTTTGSDINIIDDQAVEPLKAGKRLLPLDLIRHIDGNRCNLLDVMPSNGRFHLFIFAGNQLASPSLKMLAESLRSDQSPLYLFNPSPLSLTQRFVHEDIKTDPIPTTNENYVVDLFLIHSTSHLDIALEELPAPFSTQWLMRVYRDAGGTGHKLLGVPEQTGVMAVIRPDGYIGLITPLNRLDHVVSYFSSFMHKRI